MPSTRTPGRGMDTPSRQTRSSAGALTPGWTVGHSELFKIPSSPSPAKTRTSTRRVSMYQRGPKRAESSKKREKSSGEGSSPALTRLRRASMYQTNKGTKTVAFKASPASQRTVVTRRRKILSPKENVMATKIPTKTRAASAAKVASPGGDAPTKRKKVISEQPVPKKNTKRPSRRVQSAKTVTDSEAANESVENLTPGAPSLLARATPAAVRKAKVSKARKGSTEKEESRPPTDDGTPHGKENVLSKEKSSPQAPRNQENPHGKEIEIKKTPQLQQVVSGTPVTSKVIETRKLKTPVAKLKEISISPVSEIKSAAKREISDISSSAVRLAKKPKVAAPVETKETPKSGSRAKKPLSVTAVGQKTPRSNKKPISRKPTPGRLSPRDDNAPAPKQTPGRQESTQKSVLKRRASPARVQTPIKAAKVLGKTPLVLPTVRRTTTTPHTSTPAEGLIAKRPTDFPFSEIRPSARLVNINENWSANNSNLAETITDLSPASEAEPEATKSSFWSWCTIL